MKNNNQSFLFLIIFSVSLFIASFFSIVACDEQLLDDYLKEVNADKISNDCVITTNIYPNVLTNSNVNSLTTITNSFTTIIVTNCGDIDSSSETIEKSSSSETVEESNDCNAIEKSTNNYPTAFCVLEFKAFNTDIRGNIIISNSSDIDYQIKHYYNDSRNRWAHTEDIHDEIISLSAGDKNEFCFQIYPLF